MIPPPKEVKKYNADMWFIFLLTACLRQAGEIIPDKTARDEVDESNKFSQLMKNKTVHLLAAFLMVYIGAEITIGGMILSPKLHD